MSYDDFMLKLTIVISEVKLINKIISYYYNSLINF